ncbi:MAG TPA: hypothetical protein VFU31_19275 [Candidatus Binatia bacterium]|nr:hypothetical protein [Candidatus Binatia bacterium]
MKKIIAAILLLASVAHAQTRVSVMSDTNGILLAPTNFFQANASMVVTGASSVVFIVDTNDFAIGTRYTNTTRRSFVAASFELTAAVAGTASVTMNVEQAGVTNRLKVSAGPLTSLVTVQTLGMPVGPGAFYYFSDSSSGSGASVAIVAGMSSKTDF